MVRCTSAKSCTGLPSIDVMMSPWRNPTAAAALPGATLSSRGTTTCLPSASARTAKIAIARMKFAIGPAATIAARRPTLL